MATQFIAGDRIVLRRNPAWGEMTVTEVDYEAEMLKYISPNGANPPITGHGPFENFEHAPPLPPNQPVLDVIAQATRPSPWRLKP